MQRTLHSLLLLFAFALAIRDAQAEIIHVPADQPTIQAGIDDATNGDQVLVAAGSYSGVGNRDLDFGGKAIMVRSAAGPAATTIVCGGSVQDPHRGFRFHLGEGASSVVDGFTIEGGFMPTPNHGGAISCQGSAPTIRNCIFNGNLCSGGSGGAINADGASSPVIESCSFTANQAEGGGGIAIITGSITGCSFELNAAGDAGAGISAVGVTTISDCIFSRNTEDGVSSHGLALIRNCSFSAQNIGVRVRSGTPVIQECTFSNMMVGVACVDFGAASVTRCYFNDNLTGVGSGAKPFHSPSISESIFTGNEHPINVSIVGGSLEIRRCTLAGNVDGIRIMLLNTLAVIENTIIAFGTGSGPAVECVSGNVIPMVSCTDIFGNAGGDWVGCVAGQHGVDGNLNLDPLFCDLLGRDFALNEGSPCAPPNSPPDCKLIGAVPVGCGTVDVPSDEAPSADLRLTVIPNPVRGVARFELGPITPLTTLSIFDSQGRLVERLQPDQGHWLWTPGSSVPDGVYFARLGGVSGSSEAVKFLYVR